MPRPSRRWMPPWRCWPLDRHPSLTRNRSTPGGGDTDIRKGCINLMRPASYLVSLLGGIERNGAQTRQMRTSRNCPPAYSGPRQESWVLDLLPPPLFQCKLLYSSDERRNSFLFQKGLAKETVLVRLRWSRNPVSEAPQSHSDRTSDEIGTHENALRFQCVKNAAKTSRLKRSSRPRYC